MKTLFVALVALIALSSSLAAPAQAGGSNIFEPAGYGNYGQRSSRQDPQRHTAQKVALAQRYADEVFRVCASDNIGQQVANQAISGGADIFVQGLGKLIVGKRYHSIRNYNSYQSSRDNSRSCEAPVRPIATTSHQRRRRHAK